MSNILRSLSRFELKSPTFNIDFETGTLSNWSFYTGMCCPLNTPTLTPAIFNRHTLSSGVTVDLYGGFPTVSPFGGNFSMRLGNDSGNKQAERCRYYVNVPSGSSAYSLIYHYAVVLEDPHHSPSDQPRMQVTATDLTTMSLIQCDSFYYTSNGSIPGFLPATVLSPMGDTVYYKSWTAGNLKFNNLGGHTIAVDFATGDCNLGAHFGYGYVDMSAGFFANTLESCGSSSVSLLGPAGYSAYRWCDASTFSITYGTTQNISVTGPGVPTTYAVILTPFAGYGCQDTLYTRVIPTTPCSGTPPPGYSYATSSVICGNPDTVRVVGYSSICGLTFQWQFSADNITWVSIPGAISKSYFYARPTAPIYFRCAVTCTSSGVTTYASAVYLPVSVGPGLYSVINPPDSICNGASFYVSTCGISTNYSLTTWYGDGSSDHTLLTTTGVRHTEVLHHYAFPGTYTIKHILYDGIIAVDSVEFSYDYSYCSTIPVKLYFDNNADCIDNAGDSRLYVPVSTEVDSNGVPVDTLSLLSGIYYKTSGAPGSIYGFRILPNPFLDVMCPSGGILFDTILPFVNLYPARYFGFNCSSIPGFDIAINTSMRFGFHYASCNIYLNNNYCTGVSSYVTMKINPKCAFYSGVPSPTSIVGNTITWSLGPTAASDLIPKHIFVQLTHSGPYLTVGDTIQTAIYGSPVIGDVNTANNSIIRIDTVKGGWDPNYIEVSPHHNIFAGTQLHYTIHFENTGNDTAFNIHIMDTLSDYLDVKSLEMVAASSEMNNVMFNIGGRNIVKFDFPHANLLDSSHHGLCDGMVVFNIKTKTGLPDGTIIPNHAGIYFDDNVVVPTDTVYSIIGIPPISVRPATNYTTVELFPNPVKDELIIKTEPDAWQSFVITNQVGQVLIQQPITGSHTMVATNSLPPGIYFITIKGNNGTVVKKFVKM